MESTPIQSRPDTKEDDTPTLSPGRRKEKRQRTDTEARGTKSGGKHNKNDEMKAFTHFLLGKQDFDPKERQEMLKQQLSHKLRAMMIRAAPADEEAREARRKTIQKLQTKLSKQAEVEEAKESQPSPQIKAGAAVQRGALSVPQAPKVAKRPSLQLSVFSGDGSEKSGSGSSSQTDEEGKEQYKRHSQYLALPAHVREAIDKVKMKNKHSDFYGRLKSLNTKIRVYQQIFYTKAPAYER